MQQLSAILKQTSYLIHLTAMLTNHNGNCTYSSKNKKVCQLTWHLQSRASDVHSTRYLLIGVIALTAGDRTDKVLLIALVFTQVLAYHVATHAEADGHQFGVGVRVHEELHQLCILCRPTCRCSSITIILYACCRNCISSLTLLHHTSYITAHARPTAK